MGTCQDPAAGESSRGCHSDPPAQVLPRARGSVGAVAANNRGPHSSADVVDRTTIWAEAIPLQSTTAQVVGDSFVANWVARFGMPATITTDQGTQFTGGTWQCMCKALGTKHLQTTAYDPQSNGMVERFHR